MNTTTAQLLDDIGIAVEVVATKADKLKADEAAKAVSSLRTALQVPRILPFSAVTGLGRRDLWRLLRDGIVGDKGVDSDGSEDDSGDESSEDNDEDSDDEEGGWDPVEALMLKK